MLGADKTWGGQSTFIFHDEKTGRDEWSANDRDDLTLRGGPNSIWGVYQWGADGGKVKTAEPVCVQLTVSRSSAGAVP